MGIVLEFRPLASATLRDGSGMHGEGELVIFPGVRIERHSLDLGYRVKNSAGADDFNGLGPNRLPRKRS